ncbi:hypothetical protein E2542_SST18814 [Spatholobus suberectus]|nr:hypothetical protein E2542_SST18814 [Spatholobus suberectus]
MRNSFMFPKRRNVAIRYELKVSKPGEPTWLTTSSSQCYSHRCEEDELGSHEFLPLQEAGAVDPVDEERKANEDDDLRLICVGERAEVGVEVVRSGRLSFIDLVRTRVPRFWLTSCSKYGVEMLKARSFTRVNHAQFLPHIFVYNKGSTGEFRLW